MAVAICLMLLIFFGRIYIWQHQSFVKMPYTAANIGCMYWAQDHYERVPCNEKGKGFLVPLDEERMKNFKRITREDTITERAIGVIYYISINNRKEYYTTGGNHPVNITRNLKVLSRYIYENYLRKKTLSKDPLTIQN